MFSKRHYEAVATAIQEAHRACDDDPQAAAGVNLAMENLADAFKRSCTAFNRGRFIRACQIGANVKARS